MQPYPAVVNPSLSRSFVTSALLKYCVTTPDPGEREHLIYGLTFSPLATAFQAKTPAASITSGFDVFVQLVIAAITRDPCFNTCSSPL